MEQEIGEIYDLTENCRDVWRELNPDANTPPTAEQLAAIRATIVASYAWTAKRLGELRRVQYAECATWALQLRAGKEVMNFQTGERYQIPDYFEVKVNASPTMEELIREQLTPPVPNVK